MPNYASLSVHLKGAWSRHIEGAARGHETETNDMFGSNFTAVIAGHATRALTACLYHADKVPTLQANATSAVAMTRLVDAAHHFTCVLHVLARHATLFCHAAS
jgi:hypothetical protein